MKLKERILKVRGAMKSVSPEELEATHEARLKQREYAENHICTGTGHPQLVKAPIFIQTSPDSRHGAQPVYFALLHFRFASLSHLFFFFHVLLLHFGNGAFTLCHCTVKGCSFPFDFYRGLWENLPCVSQEVVVWDL